MWSPSLFGVYAVVISVRAQEVRREHGFANDLFQNAMDIANESLNGRFIQEMVSGELPTEVFQRYLYQDNLYLSKYSRAFAVLAARAKQTDELVWLLNKSISYLHEHGQSANVDLSEETFEHDASPVTIAYTSFFLQAAWSEHPIFAYAAVLPCQRLYDWLFATLKKTHSISSDNPYKIFIDQYADPRNHETSIQMEAFLDRYADQGMTADMVERARFHYNQAMKYEVQFFDQGFQDLGGTSFRTTNAVARQRRSLSDLPIRPRLGHGKILLASGTTYKERVAKQIERLPQLPRLAQLPQLSQFPQLDRGRGGVAAALAFAMVCYVVVSLWKH